MDRRQFIKVTAATGASATLASCGNPENQVIRFLPVDDIIPGVAQYRPSICPLCSSGCGVTVRVMEAEVEVVRNGQAGITRMAVAKKLEGNAAHPVNQGKLCVRGQAAIQVTYHPDRIKTPMKRSGERGSGSFQPITWDEALAELVGKLDELATASDQRSLGFLTRPLRGQRYALVSRFLARYGAPNPIEFEVFGDQVLRRANARSFGYEQLPTLDLARTRYVISFGADFLGTWNSPVSQSIGYGEMRQGTPGQRGKFVQVEPRMSQTGANADEWLPASPGTEGFVALGIAHVIMRDGLRPASGGGRAGNQIDGWSAGLSAYTPEAVERVTGLRAERLERVAREFASNGPAIAIIGGAALAQTNGMSAALAVNALNALVGSVGVPGGINFTPRAAAGMTSTQASPSMQTVAADLLAAERSPIQVLMLHDANPVFGTPAAWRVREALLKIPYIVSFGQFIDETSALADLILPDRSFLESWVDHTPESGTTMSVTTLAAPAMKPLYPETRPTMDVLLDVSRRLGTPLGSELPWETFDAMLQSGFSAEVWTSVQQRGGEWTEAPARADASPAQNQAPVAFAEPQFDGDATQYPFHFMPYLSQAFLDGSLAHLPWLQELPDVISTAMWSSWVEINAQRAAELGINTGDLLEVTSSAGTVRAPALVSPGISPDLVAMPIGQGHENYTRYATGRGANPIAILAAATEPETGSLAWAATRVRVTKVEGDGGLILFAGGMREHSEHGR